MPQMHGGAAGGGTTVIAVRCPTCATLEDKVVDSRASEDGVSIRRRRQCLACGARFTTFERLEEQPLMVVKRSGDRVPFERAKIESGVAAAAKGRPLSGEQIAELALSLEDELRLIGGDVTSERIGLAVLERLGELDQVAYVRFASVYKEFDRPEDFEREITLLQKSTAPKPRVEPSAGRH